MFRSPERLGHHHVSGPTAPPRRRARIRTAAASLAAAAIATTLTLTLAAPAQASVADDRANAGADTHLTFQDPNNGSWNTGSGEAWQPALSIDVVINQYQRTGDVRYLDSLNRSFERYRNRSFSFYDDAGWYALAWVRAFDVTGDGKYMDEARAIFSWMTTGWDDTCGGGTWWNTDRQYKNAITNELFLQLAAKLERRGGGGEAGLSYGDWAFRTWNWFDASGMINANGLVNDGLTDQCQNNSGITWTYNQGVILGGLTELYYITGDRFYLYRAEIIAEAATSTLVHSNGILREPCEPAGSCDGDQVSFKGIFTQNLARLYHADRGNKPQYYDFLTANATSAWDNARGDGNYLGLTWTGPYSGSVGATHTSAMMVVGVVALLDAGYSG